MNTRACGQRTRGEAPLHPLAYLAIAYAFVINMLGTTLPTPVYALYKQNLGFSELMITVIFAAYAFGVIAALFLAGSWSDQVGRRRMLLAGLAFSAVSAVAFLVAGGLALLLIGRVLSGISAGIFTSTASVAVVEMAPASKRGLATLVATAANMGGLGLGPVLAGLLTEYAPLPIRLCFIVDLALVGLAAVAVLRAPETVNIAARPRLRAQRLSLPRPVRGVFVPAIIGGCAGFAVLGMFTGVTPAFLRHVLHISNHAITGAMVFTLFAASTLGQLALQKVPKRWAMPVGCLLLAIGGAMTAGAVGIADVWLFLAGAFFAGFGQGLSFRAGLAAVTAASPPDRAGEVVSTYFILLYVANSIPVIGIGFTAAAFGLQTAGMGFATAVAALALIALPALVWHWRHRGTRHFCSLT